MGHVKTSELTSALKAIHATVGRGGGRELGFVSLEVAKKGVVRCRARGPSCEMVALVAGENTHAPDVDACGIAVPTQSLVKVISSLSDFDEVELLVVANGLQIKHGRFAARLVGEPSGDRVGSPMSVVAREKVVGKFDATARSALMRVDGFRSKTNEQYLGAFLMRRSEADDAWIVAVDGQRIAAARATSLDGMKFDFQIPEPAIQFVSASPADVDVAVDADEALAALVCEERRMSCEVTISPRMNASAIGQAVFGGVPQWWTGAAIGAADSMDERFRRYIVAPTALRATLERAGLVANVYRSIDVCFRSDEITVAAESDSGSMEEGLPCRGGIKEEPIAIRFNVDFLIDAIAATAPTSGDISLWLRRDQPSIAPLVLSDDWSVFAGVMPMTRR